MSDDAMQADQEGDLPHPRTVYDLFGHDRALEQTEQALNSGRMHHAWMITGPKGVGKASFSYRLVRRLLGAAQGSDGALSSRQDDPVCKRIEALSHPDFLLIRPPYNQKTGKLKTEIPVEEARRAPEFFSKSASGEGWRVCIVDCADELNTNSANALLKTLEEPPQRGLLLLIVNTSGRLLPTIRSRCRTLALRAPSQENTTQWLMDRHNFDPEDAKNASALAQGAPGRALALARMGGVELKQAIDAALAQLPQIDRAAMGKLASEASRKGGESVKSITLDFLIAYAQKCARTIALKDETPQTAARWVNAADELTKLAAESETLYLDAKQTLYAAFALIQDAAKPD